jgi:hypothetical protein
MNSNNSVEVIISDAKENYLSSFRVNVKRDHQLKIILDIKQDPKPTDIQEAVIVFPKAGDIFEGFTDDNYLQTVMNKNYNELDLTVNSDPISGEYTYHIWLPQKKEFVDKPKNTAPKIIVDG